MSSDYHFAYFGTSLFSVIILEELKAARFIPSLVVTTPDEPQGRKLILTPSPVKVWAEKNEIPFIQPKKLSEPGFLSVIGEKKWDFFAVASYGKIIPQSIIDMPAGGTLNVHPSLLPLYRGPSPVQTQILEGAKEVGVSIMLIDAEVDHGPVLAEERLPMPEPLPSSPELKDQLGHLGGKLLAHTIPLWLNKKIEPRAQDDSKATFTKLIKKDDGLLDLLGDQTLNFRKFKAFAPWPGTYFFHETDGKKIRVLIKDAEFKDGQFLPTRVLPEGKKEMDYNSFLQGYSRKTK